MWRVRIGTIFPGLFPGPLGISCIGRQLGKLWSLEVDDLRQFASDKHKSVDDEPFGGGGGMIIRPDVVDNWLNSQKKLGKIVYVSPRGRVFSNKVAKELIKQDLCILCGRYEGVDSRVLKHWEIEEISIGDFILHGGEIAAMVIVETCLRYLKGMIKVHSVENDTFESGLLEFDYFTRPAKWIPINSEKLYNVPEVLRSGNHAEIDEWRRKDSMRVTKKNRPDLLRKYQQNESKKANGRNGTQKDQKEKLLKGKSDQQESTAKNRGNEHKIENYQSVVNLIIEKTKGEEN